MKKFLVCLLVTLFITNNLSADCTFMSNLMTYRIAEYEWSSKLLDYNDFIKKTDPDKFKSYKSKIKHYVIIPEAEEDYKRIFDCGDRVYDYESDKLNIINARENFKRINSIIAPSDGQYKDFEFFIKSLKPDERIVTIIGHNNNGDLIFPNGEVKKIEEICRLSEKYDKLFIFISCSSDNYINISNSIGIHQDITFSDAFKLAESLQNKINNESITLENLNQEINRVIRTYEIKNTSIKIFKSGGAIIAIIISCLGGLEISDKSKEDKDSKSDDEKNQTKGDK